MYAQLEQYGLGDLAKTLLGYVQQGYDGPTATLLIQQTDDWKQRFYGNVLRQKAGLAALDPASYLDLEKQYGTVLHSFGIPQGMFGRADFATWIGGDVSPVEIQSRANLAAQAVYNADPFYSQSLAQLGVDQGHQVAYFLDSNRALPYIQNVAQAAQIGAAALRNNLQMDPNTALTLASMGVSQNQAQAGYKQVAEELPRLGQLAQIQNQNPYTQATSEQANLFGNAAAERARQGLVSNEEALFRGSSGMGTNYLHPQYAVEPMLQGSF